MDKKPGTYHGCLVGCAVGDAVGAPVERKTVAAAREYLLVHVDPIDFEVAPQTSHEGLSFGHYTDDTLFLREMMISLYFTGGVFDPADYASRLAILMHNQSDQMGGTMRIALSKMLAGETWDKSGDQGSGGNGSVVRAAALGLVYGTPLEVIAAARMQSVCTHASNNAQLAAVVMAMASFKAARTLVDVELRRDQFAIKLAGYIEPLSSEFAAQIYRMAGFLREDVVEALDADEECLRYITEVVQAEDPRSRAGVGPFCKSSVLWALYSFLKTPYDFWATIRLAVWAGGDTDTVAAMAGCLSGIHNGVSQVPEAVLHALRDTEGRDHTYLQSIASSLEQVAQERLLQNFLGRSESYVEEDA